MTRRSTTPAQRAAARANLAKARAAKKRGGLSAGAVKVSAIRARTPAQQKHYAHLANRVAAAPPHATNPYAIHPVTGTTSIRGGV